MKKGIIVLFLAAAMFTACKKEGNTKSEGTVLIQIGKETITVKDIDAELKTMPAQYQTYYSTEEGRKLVLEKLTETVLLSQEGIKAGYEKDPEFIKEVSVAKKRILARLTYDKQVLGKAKATPEELKNEYEKQKEKYKIEAEVKASHILLKIDAKMSRAEKLKVKKEAQKILKEAQSGKTPFAELAKKKSQGPSKSNGGELGWFDKKKMVAPFATAAFKGKKGTIYPEVVETRFGYHIIAIEDKREAGYKPLDEVKEELSKGIESKKSAETFKVYIKDLKKKYNVKGKEEKKEEVKKEEKKTK